jgi:hypothetical protein
MAQHLHFFLPDIKESIPYTSNATRGPQANIPERDVAIHGRKLMATFKEIWKDVQQNRDEREAISIKSRQGTYLEFKSSAGYDLTTKSLEDIRQGVRLLNIRQTGQNENEEILCTVYVPAGKENFFLKKISDYTDPENLTLFGKPKNQKLINSIDDIKIAFVESLWTDPIQFLPNGVPSWCEVWLRHNNTDFQTIIDAFLALLEENAIEHKHNFLNFPERAVLIVKVNRNQLAEIVSQTDYLAEIRIAQETASFWTEQSNTEQQEWAQNLLDRLQIDDNINVRVCILDSGVNNGHSLLAPLLEDRHCLTVRPSWHTSDHESGSGHGTLMSGIAAYNNIEEILESAEMIAQSHKLCSVKILPPPSQEATPPELWGDITSQAISRIEIILPEERIVYCMAVTSDQDIDQGRPSSWSGAIDNIAFSENSEKLIIISAGNINNSFHWDTYPHSNLAFSVQNPAQSWNSLVAGAYTEKVIIKDSSYNSYTPIASKGQLSPFSSTSCLWDKKWPTRPDVVFEGGNILRNNTGDFVDRHEDFGALSTSKIPFVRQFDTINATSAATAKASWMAAKIMSVYENAWPETIRALIIHSAEWKEEMFSQFNKNPNNKSDIKDMLRIFGYGVPNIDKALFSYNNALTFISQNTIQPFKKVIGSSPKTNEMHFFELPWPKEELLANPDIEVTLKVTLSYFIEPGIGEIGWKDKYRYRSHGLCFDVNSETEEVQAFQSRINKAIRDEDEGIEFASDSGRWKIGMQGRKSGSVHSDSWTGTAAQLAACNLLAVYPIIGWWRQRSHLNKVDSKTRYSLIVTLETPITNIELYTPVEVAIQNIVPILIETNNI